MAEIPKIIDLAVPKNMVLSYTGFVNELPKNGTVGQVVFEVGSNLSYAFDGAQWVELASLAPTKTIKEELLEVLDRHKGSKIAEDVRNLLEVYERNSYI